MEEHGDGEERSTLELFRHMMEASKVPAPVLENLSEKEIKKFLVAYEDYTLQLPSHAVPKRMQECIKAGDMRQILAREELTKKHWEKLKEKAVIKHLCHLHAAISDDVAISKVERIPALKTNSWESIQAFHEEWRYTQLLIGEESAISDKVLVKLYIKKIGITNLRVMVENGRPTTLVEAQERLVVKAKTIRDLKQILDIGQNTTGITCFNCGKTGHKSSECRSPKKESNQNKVEEKTGPVCAYCKKTGHKEEECRKKKHVCLKCKKTGHWTEECSTTGKKINTMLFSEMEKNLFSPNPDRLFRRQILVDEKLYTALFDSGATVSCISHALYLKLQHALVLEAKEEALMSAKKESQLVSIGTCMLQGDLILENYQLHIRVRCHVVKDLSEDIILGLECLSEHSLLSYMEDTYKFKADVPAIEDDMLLDVEIMMVESITSSQLEVEAMFPEKERLQKVLEENAKLFTPLDSHGILVEEVTLTTRDGQTPKSQTVRYLSPPLREAVIVELNRLENEGRIAKVRTTVKGASPLVVVPKPDGSIRLAVDFRQLNQLLVPVAGSIPDYREFFPYLRGKNYFCKIDNLQGFLQLKLDANTQELCTICTPVGLYKFLFLPFGVNAAPTIYQQTMERILEGLHRHICVVFIDDTIIFAETPDELVRNTKLVLDRLADFNVKLKSSKCKWGVEEVEFVGHVFNKKGYALSEERKKAVTILPQPTNLKQLRGLLGTVNYFRAFIPNLSTLLVPLTDLTKGHDSKVNSTKVKLAWTEECEAAWKKVKVAVADSGALGMVRDVGELVVYCDASTQGVGGHLSQLHEGIEVPIVFVSCKFSDAATRWSTIVQECWAIVYVVQSLRVYLLGRRFIIRTDHKNLLFLMSSQIPKLVRLRLQLLEYQFTIEHVAGVDNVVADLLSRVNLISSTDTLSILVEADKGTEGISTADSKEEVIKSFHNLIVGHCGIQKTMDKINAANMGWKDLRHDVQLFVRSCPTCQKVKYQNTRVEAGAPHTLSVSSPMQRICIDAIGPLPKDDKGSQYILVFIDACTKFCVLYECDNVTASEYVRCLLLYVGMFGIMKEIWTDGGSQFTATVAQDMGKWLQVKQTVIVAYHPQGNGLVERRNAEVMKHLRALVFETRLKKQWSIMLPLVQRIVNSLVDSSLGTSPARLMFGAHMPIHDNMVPATPNMRVVDFVSALNAQLVAALQVSNEVLRQRDKEYKQRVIKYDVKRKHPVKVGDYVLLTYPSRPPSKLDPVLRGPYIVLEKERDDIVTIRSLLSSTISTVHVDRLRLFHVPSNVLPQDLLTWASADSDEFIVEEILDHRGNIQKKASIEFLVRWAGYGPEDNSWEPFANVRDCKALDVYERQKGLKF